MKNHMNKARVVPKPFAFLIKDLMHDRGCSERQLAEKAHMTRSQIEQITTGRKKKLDIQELVSLADAFDLTSVTRREFFLAAITDLDPTRIARPKDDRKNREYPDAYKVRAQVIRTLAALRVPAFATDAFCDILAANEMCIRLLDIPESTIKMLNTMPVGGNTMRVVFDEKTGFKELMGETNWHRNLWMNMAHFVSSSLRYRSDPYYEYAKQTLMEDLPLFKDYWDRFDKEIEDHYMDMDPIEIDYPNPLNKKEKIKISYAITQSLIYTTCGELTLTTYLPNNREAVMLFAQLDEEVDSKIDQRLKSMKQIPRDKSQLRVRVISPWPEKPMLKR